MPTEYIDNFTKDHPYSKMSDGYCTVAWGGDNPNGGTYFRITNNTNDNRKVKFYFTLKNSPDVPDSHHEETHNPYFYLSPNEQKDVCVDWTIFATGIGKRPLVSFDSHSTTIDSVTSTIEKPPR